MLGDGSFDACPLQSCTTPRAVVGLSSGVERISAGGDHSCAVLTTGGVECWGYNSSAQLGTGAITDPVNTPVSVQGLTASAIDVSAGGSESCALLVGGSVACWGAGIWLSPIVVSLSRPATAVSSGGRICALLDDQTLACETARDSSGLTMAVVPGLSNVTSMCADDAGYHTCVVAGGEVLCWGYNGNAQCGQDPSVLNVSAPTAVAGLASSAVDVVCGGMHSCALLGTGEVQCWGESDYGQVGIAPTLQSPRPWSATPVTIPIPDAASISARGDFTCVLTANGKVACWGNNSYGQLGSGLDASSLPWSAMPLWLQSP
jgi:alpha-tubulin suppressor-like RCC1 family protein